ncbi:RyR domain-containing protein [Acidiphilium angustum]|uniref:RyR domain-containing protein n=1 Tax=Acidiphilium angustum TaxID=523 RepID=UPI000AA5A16F|nr:RyR domain-containing protein [Acidiphilium angustum]
MSNDAADRPAPSTSVDDQIAMAEQQIAYMDTQLASEERQLEARLARAPDSETWRAAMLRDSHDRMAHVRRQREQLVQHVAALIQPEPLKLSMTEDEIKEFQEEWGKLHLSTSGTMSAKDFNAAAYAITMPNITVGTISASEVMQNQRVHLPVADVARVAHEINRAYCEAIGDFSLPAWEDAPDWQVRSIIQGVEFHRANRNATPAASHESWMAEKQRDGWVEGPVKNPELKQHPCMVPFDKLPIEQRVKDFLFRACVHALS